MKVRLTSGTLASSIYSKAILFILLVIASSANIYAIDGIELTGNITEIGSDYIVVQSLKFYVNEETEIRGHSNDPLSFAVLKLNYLVEVKGDDNGDGSYTATRIRLEDSSGSGNKDEVRLTGYVTELGVDHFTINGTTFLVDVNTEFRGRHGNAFSFAQVEVGVLLEVRADKQINGDLVATRVRIEDEAIPHKAELEITGFIDEVTANSIKIKDLEIFVDAQTIILDDHRMPIAFSELNVGNKVEVKAFRNFDSTYVAALIKLEDVPEDEIEFTAQIESIVSADITINGITFKTDSNTVFLDHNRMPVTIAALAVGMWVEVKGSKNNDGTFYASRIQIEDFIRTELELKGKIIELSETSLVVNGITFSIDSTTQVVDHMNKPIEYSALEVGQLVEVKGEKTGELTAKALLIHQEFEEDIEIFGRITAINSDNIEINGLTVYVDSSTVYLNHANMPITFAELNADQFVEVKMIKTPDSTLLALRIKIEDAMSFSKVDGFTSAIDGSSIQLPSGIYAINSQTVVVDNNFNKIDASKLTAGESVIVWSSVDASSNKVALQIQSKTSSPTGVAENNVRAESFILKQNYPNPFNPATTITFTILSDQLVTLKVFNALGEEVRTLVNNNLSKGTHTINFNANGLASGLYLYRLESGSQVEVKKMMLLK